MDEPKTTPEEVNDGMVAALLHEREGYQQRARAAAVEGDEKAAKAMADRIGQVDEQLKLRGAEPPKDAVPAAKRGQQTRA